MNKIKTRKDARALAELLISENPNLNTHYCPGYEADKPFIKLQDAIEGNCLMIYIRKDEECEWLHLVYFTDTVNDTEYCKWMTIQGVEDQLWNNRKFINTSGQLESL